MLCFETDYKQVRERIDPVFYQPKYVILDHLIGSVHHQRLGSICQFSADTEDPTQSPDTKFLYIDITSINPDLGLIENPQHILGREAPSRARKVIRQGDILVSTVRPYRNAVAPVPPELDGSICSTGFAVIRKVSNECLREYLLIVLRLNLLTEQLVRHSMGSAYPAVTEEDLKKIAVPLPSLERQREIVAMVEGAYAQRNAKLRRAEELLKGIDGFVMQSLGIHFDDPSFQRSFQVEYRLLSDRIEAEYYQPEFSRLDKALEQGSYPLVSLGHIIRFIRNGIDCRDYVTAGTPYIRVTDIGKDGTVDLNNANQVPMTPEQIEPSLRLREGDVLFTRKGTPGNVAIVRGTATSAIISSEIILIRLRDFIVPEYFEAFFNSLPGCRQVQRNTRGALNVGINHPTLSRLLIPLPADKQIQRDIAQEVEQRRLMAQELRRQGLEVIEKVKTQTEAMILGQE